MRTIHFFKKNKQSQETFLHASRTAGHPFSALQDYLPLSAPETGLYESLREGVPIIDSAIQKTVRLAGGFEIICNDRKGQRLLDDFRRNVNVGGVGKGLENFAAGYLDDLLTYGNAVGEIVVSRKRLDVAGLYLADCRKIRIKPSYEPLEVEFYADNGLGDYQRIRNKELVLFTALNPRSGEFTGTSVLRSLPFVTDTLFKIYYSIGQNFDRIGNIRYAVTYKPGNDSSDRAYAKERAGMIAKEWAEGMKSGAAGTVKDFVAVGDINIKVIGADNQMIDTEIPVRQMLEQIVAKLSIPPFLLGLSWSTTERMSKQQTDILTTELEYYRRLITPVLLKICRTYLRLNGVLSEPEIEWNTINLKDEVEAAQARYYLAKAKEIEQTLKGGNKD